MFSDIFVRNRFTDARFTVKRFDIRLETCFTEILSGTISFINLGFLKRNITDYSRASLLRAPLLSRFVYKVVSRGPRFSATRGTFGSL